MDEPNDATPFLPENHTLSALREAAAGCRGGLRVVAKALVG